MKLLTTFFAIVGIVTIVYGIVGLIVDIRSFDQTKGGYEYPYEGWSGTPVNWDSLDATQTGLVKRGHVIDVHINCSTGMISFEVFGMRKNWQIFSDRALIVHQPRAAFKKRGFKPQF